MKRILTSVLALMLALSLCTGALGEKVYEVVPAVDLMPEWVTLPQDRTEEDIDWNAQNPAVLDTHLAAVYDQRLDRCQYLTVADVEGYEDVPFVSVREYMKGLFEDTVTFFMQEDKKAFFINRNGVNAVIDLENPSIRCDAWEWFMGRSDKEGQPVGLVLPAEMSSIRADLSGWYFTHNDSYTISLDYDGLALIMLEDDVLMPFLALQNAVGVRMLEKESFPVYNGDDFYTTASGFAQKAREQMSPYEKAYFSGRFTAMEKPSEAYAKYNYACLCLMIDHYFGHKEQLGIGSFDAWIAEQGLKEGLLSTEPEAYVMALTQTVQKLFNSGHDTVSCSSSVFGSAEKLTKLAEELLNPQPEDPDAAVARQVAYVSSLGESMQELLRTLMGLRAKVPAEFRDAATGEPNPAVRFEGDTAFVFFPGFKENLKRASFYTSLPAEADEPTSTFAFFYNAFAKIKEHPEVKNVVIDLSVNGGGAVAALVSTLGFISQTGEVNMTYCNTISDNYKVEAYSVDTNLDGKFDDEDGYGGQYDFYIITSSGSYSCANALPYLAQKNGLAKIVGMAPGGGDCAVSQVLDGYGIVCGISGYMKIGCTQDGVFVSNETDTVVDIPFESEEMYFDYPAIAELIHAYQDK